MGLPIPNLDDRTFEELLNEARALIPVYHKEWTNHNPSDPGITLLELFAWLSEMTIYRINQIPEENYQAFLKLLGIELREGESLASGIRRGLESLTRRYRAITSEDYECLALEALRLIKPDLRARAICVPNRNLEYGGLTIERPGHISVIVIPQTPENGYRLTDDARIQIKRFLDQRRLITTRVHVVNPVFRLMQLVILLTAKQGASAAKVQQEAESKVRQYFNPVTGGSDGSGWPLGRSIYRSEVYHLLQNVSGIDHVSQVTITGNETPLLPMELVLLPSEEFIIQVERSKDE